MKTLKRVVGYTLIVGSSIIALEDILHIEACGSYSTVFLNSGRGITISKNLSG